MQHGAPGSVKLASATKLYGCSCTAPFAQSLGYPAATHRCMMRQLRMAQGQSASHSTQSCAASLQTQALALLHRLSCRCGTSCGCCKCIAITSNQAACVLGCTPVQPSTCTPGSTVAPRPLPAAMHPAKVGHLGTAASCLCLECPECWCPFQTLHGGSITPWRASVLAHPTSMSACIGSLAGCHWPEAPQHRTSRSAGNKCRVMQGL